MARRAISTGRFGDTATAALVIRNQIPVIRKVLRTPITSIMGPATMAAIAEVAKKDVMTQGASDTFPRSFVILGKAAIIASPSKAATATTVKFATVMGKYRADQMLVIDFLPLVVPIS
tara:strand:+ start:530 stop:883 length:354 start_codon:yes stop_codon:yes gene_type:complete